MPIPVNNSGHIKDQTSDDNGFRQFIINCFGSNDQRKYFSISPFGIDFNAPIGTRSLVSDSINKDVKYNLGVLNKLKIEDLNPGECAIFSTDEPGEAIMSKIVLRNTGDIEINKDLDNGSITIGVDGSIQITGKAETTITVDGNASITATGDVEISADGNVNITATKCDINGNLTVE
jgi:hypothetical protein